MKLTTELQLDATLLKKGYRVLRSLNNSTRQKIINILHKEGKVNVSGLYKRLGIEQSATSLHLKILREAGFIEGKSVGHETFYYLDYERFAEVNKHVKKIV